MKNFKLSIQYDGSNYKGWQKLGNSENTIQYKIEKVLSSFFNDKIEVIASGRTDAGVHALKQIANFKTNTPFSIDKLLDHCSKYLPQDIVIFDCQEVSENFHSRYNVKKKVYTYKIYNDKYNNIFNRKYSYHVSEPLDIKKMREASKVFIGEHDFKSFTALKSKTKSTVKDIYSIDFKRQGNNIDIIFTGKGFLHKMIRILTSTLIEAGLSNITPDEIKTILDQKDRSLAPSTAPAHGLVLSNVEY